MVVDTSSFGLSKEGETGSDFARPPIKSKGKLWNEGDPALSHSTALATVAHAFQLRNARASGRRHNASKSAPMPPAADEPEDPSVSLIITQPETRSISQEQLVAEVKEIYAGLVMIESKCIEVDSAHSVQNDNAARPSNDQLQVPQAQGEGITKITYDTMLADHPYTYSPRKNPPPANNSTVDYSSGGRVRYVDGEANGVSVRSLPDTGAAECCISSSFATRLGKTPMQGTARKVAVGSGKKLSSPGTVSLVWRFQDETDLYDMVCTVVPGLKHDLILGLPFLKLTKTMSKFKHRIKHTVSKVFTRFSKKLFFSLLGVQRQRLWGLLDGELTGVVPDSGSDVVLISEAYAKQRGFKVNRRNADRLELEFADGSIGRTSGVVENLTWAFDDKTSIKTNFYVLRGLPVDVVLSNDLLFDFDVYSSYEHQILDADASAAAELLFVRLLGRYKSKHRDAENINELRRMSETLFSSFLLFVPLFFIFRFFYFTKVSPFKPGLLSFCFPSSFLFLETLQDSKLPVL